MKKQHPLPVGWRTIKTSLAILISMLAVTLYGATADRLIFAMLGAMAAVGVNCRESLAACAAQMIDVAAGTLFGAAVRALPIHLFLAIGIGILALITLYHLFCPTLSPSLPCFILAYVCIFSNISPLAYALGRTWDTVIGILIGLLINLLVYPYDNAGKIHAEVAAFLEEVTAYLQSRFSGSDGEEQMRSFRRRVAGLEMELHIYSGQKLLHRLSQQRLQMERQRVCLCLASQLLVQLEAFHALEALPPLSKKNLALLSAAGVMLPAAEQKQNVCVVADYHLERILSLRQSLKRALLKMP